MPAKKDTKTDWAQLSLRIEKELSDRIDDYWKFNRYQDKTSFVRDALEYYINAVKCNRCETMNPAGATHCAICGVAIGEYDKIKTKIEEQYNSIKDYISTVVTPNYGYTKEQEIKVSSLFYHLPSIDNPLSADKCLVLSLSYMWAELDEIKKLLKPILDGCFEDDDEDIQAYIKSEQEEDKDFRIPGNHIFWKLHNAYLTISGVSVDYDPKLSEKKLFYNASEKELYLTQFDLNECSDTLKKAVNKLNKLSSYYTDILKNK